MICDNSVQKIPTFKSQAHLSKMRLGSGIFILGILTLGFLPPVWAGPIEDFRYAAGLFNRGIYEDAAAALASFITAYPEHELAVEARFWSAEALRLSDKPGPARDQYTAILPAASGARRAEILLGRAETSRALRDPAAAGADFRAAADFFSDTERERILTQATLSFLEAGDTASAVPLFAILMEAKTRATVEWAGATLGAALIGKDNAGAADAYRRSAVAATSYEWSLEAHLRASTLYQSAGNSDLAESERGEASNAIAERRGRSKPTDRIEEARLFREEFDGWQRLSGSDTGLTVPDAPVRRGSDVISAYLPEITSQWVERGETAAVLVLIDGLDAIEILPLAIGLHQAEARRDPSTAAAHWEAVVAATRSYADRLPPGSLRADAHATMADALLELERRSDAAAAYISVAEEARAPLAREALRNALLLLEDDSDIRLQKLFIDRPELMAQAEPARGQSEPVRGQSEPVRGQSEPAHGQAEPVRGSDELLQLRATYALRRGDTDASLAHLQRMSQTPTVKEQRALLLLDRHRTHEALALYEELVRNSPNEALLMELGRVALEAGEPARAAQVYERFTNEFPNSVQTAVAYYGLGLSLNRIGQSETARAALRKALATPQQESEQARLERSRLESAGESAGRSQAGRTGESLPISPVAGLDPLLRRGALRLLAALTFNAQEAREAARLYDQLIMEGVNDDDAYFRAGLSHLASDNPTRAAECLAALLARWPSSPFRSRTVIALAEASILSGRARQSGEIIMEAARNVDARPRLLDLADDRLSESDAQSAEEIAGRVIDACNGTASDAFTAARAYSTRGWARLERKRDLEAAHDFSTAADYLAASDTTAILRGPATGLPVPGGRVQPNGLFEGLVTSAERLMKNDPNQASLLLALRLLERVPTEQSLTRRASLRRGEALELLMRDTEAATAYHEACAVDRGEQGSDSIIVQIAAVRLGDLRMKVRSWNEAAAAYRIALAVKSPFAAVELALGAALRQAGRETEAVAVLMPLVSRTGNSSTQTPAPPASGVSTLREQTRLEQARLEPSGASTINAARLELAFSLLNLGRPAEADSLLQQLEDLINVTTASAEQALLEPDRIAYGRGLAARALGDTFAARRQLLKVVLSYPNSPAADESLFLVGQLELALGRIREARDSFATLLTHYPHSPRIQAARRILSELETR